MNETPSDPSRGDGTPDPTSEQPTYPTAPLGPMPAGPPPQAQGPGSPLGTPLAAAVRERPRRRRTTLAAGVVAATLVLGGGAGFGGAALWSAVDDDGGAGGTASATTARTSQVVDTPRQAAADGSVEQVAAQVLPSVVKIEVSGAQESGSGSGIILSSEGRILTNNHVVEVAADGGTITVAFNDGTSARAEIVGTDPLTDTALIQAQDVSGLTPATIGRSSDLAVGQSVVAVGSPFGLESTVTSGIVSALDRPVDVGSDGAGNSTVYPAIQTDAAINPGNSGGALVDLNGHVVGINSSIRTASSAQSEAGSIGLGFAIPMDEVMPIVDQMANGETPTHARLGISVSDVSATPESGGSTSGAVVTEGARVQEVTSGSTADSAGLVAGDVVTKVDDQIITGADSLVATIRSYRPGDKVTVTYVSDGETKTAEMELDSDATASNG